MFASKAVPLNLSAVRHIVLHCHHLSVVCDRPDYDIVSFVGNVFIGSKCVFSRIVVNLVRKLGEEKRITQSWQNQPSLSVEWFAISTH